MKKQFIFLCFLSLFVMFSSTYSQIIPDFKVNDGERDEGISPSISVDRSGNFMITWWEHYHPQMGCSYNLYAQRYSSDGTAMGGNFKVNTKPGSAWPTWGTIFPPSISTDDSGNFVITWWHDCNYNDDYDIYAQRYSGEGTAMGGNFIVNSDTSGEGQYSPSVSTDSSGNFVITWGDTRDDENNIYAQRYSRDGTALENNFKVNSFTDSTWRGTPGIASDGSGNFVITWSDTRNGQRDIYVQRFSSDGTPLGSSFKINHDEVSLHYHSIVSDDIGNFVITWMERYDEGFDIYAQRFSSSGSALNSIFKVNDIKGSVYWEVISISSDGSGNFVIAWTDVRDIDTKIYGQRYSSDGTAIGANFLITQTGANPDVVLRDGRIYTTWNDNRGNETGSDIWTNVLDWDNPVVEISERNATLKPATYQLNQNYPNPFNPKTVISYKLKVNSDVELSIYNLLGQKVATLVNKKQAAGRYEVEWDASGFSSGVYLYQLKANSQKQNAVLTKKLVLLK